MPLFVMIGTDGPDGASRRDENREKHLALWENMDAQGRITLGGPVRNAVNNASLGAVIVFEADSLEAARSLVSRDPYVAGGVYESMLVAPFKHVFPKKP